jgi:hypothetical protein
MCPPEMRRFYYRISSRNRYNVLWAYSRLDALRRLAYGEDMVHLQEVEWLND